LAHLSIRYLGISADGRFENYRGHHQRFRDDFDYAFGVSNLIGVERNGYRQDMRRGPALRRRLNHLHLSAGIAGC
jgi:hypothetical protein